MAAVSGSYGSLLQGMSQQPPQSRGEGQCQLQVNMVSDPVSDLSKRPATVLKGELTGAEANTYFHHYERGDGEEYIFCINSGELRVFDLDGTEYTVNGTQTYLNTAKNPNVSFDTLTIGDLTLIANKDKVVEFDTTVPQVGLTQSTIELKGTTWATTYTIQLEEISTGNKFTVEYQTPSGVGDATASPVDPELDKTKLKLAYVTGGLRDAINAAVSGAASIPAGTENLITINTSLVNIVNVDDGKNNSFLIHVNKVIDKPEKLPATSKHNRVVKVEPTGTDSSANYYMRFNSENGNDYSEGKWVEHHVINTFASSTDEDYDFRTDLKATTMPHGVVRLQDSSGNIFFQFSPLDGSTVTSLIGDDYEFPNWATRNIGDEETNPTPSFVGSTVTSMGLFQERLYFLSDEAIVLSTADDYFDFFYSTALDVLDKDPIDFTASTNEINYLLHGIIHDRDLVLFSENAQFVISGDQPLTPNNAYMTPVTFFKSAPKCKPIQSGRSIYFAIVYGEFSGVRELQTDAVSATRDAPPISAHVSKLIQGSAVQMSNSNETGILTLSTDTYDNRLYTYEYLWSGNERIQSSWSYWEFDEDYQVLHHFFVKTVLYAVLRNKKHGYVRLVACQVEDFVFTDFGFNIYLDFLQKIETRRITDPEDPLRMISVVDIPKDFKYYDIIQSSDCPYPGMRAGTYTSTDYTNSSITVQLEQDYGEGAHVYVGIPFEARYQPTRPFVKDRKDVVITNGVLTVSKYLLTYRNSGYIESEITSKYNDTIVNGKMSGRVVGAKGNTVGTSPITSGTVKVAFLSDPDNATMAFISNDYRPMTLIDLEWEGQFSYNKRRL